jgi:hypothetical protein
MRQAWALLWLALAAAGAARGQGSFVITVRDAEAARQVPNGATVEFAGRIGEAKDVYVEILYAGTTRGELGVSSLTGTADFQFAGSLPTPAILTPGQRAIFQLRFQPSTSRRTLAQLGVTARELPPEGSNLLPGSFGLLLVGLSGTAPEVKFAYALGTDGNLLPLADGGVIRIGKAPVNGTTLATVLVINAGTAPAKVESVSMEGAAELELIQLPLLPLDLAAGQSVQFRIRYQPKELAVHEATLRMAAEGQTAVVRVEGVAQGPKWTYSVMPEPGAESGTAVAPDGVVDLGEVELGRRKRAWIRVRNDGNDEGVIAGVAVSGEGYGLVDPPLPQTVVKAGGEIWFGVSLTALQAGRQTGRLRVGADTFVVTAMAVGAMLEYSYQAGETTLLQTGGQVVLPASAVGQTTAVRFVVENKGNRAATIATISVSGAGKAFSLASVPPLPLVVGPEERAEFQIRFTPVQPGINTDVLTVGNAFFNLTGSAAVLPDLPGYRFEGPSGTVAPMTQPAVGLTLQAAYPVTLRGTLTMTVDAANFGADPAVQFSTGGRVVSFTIPAGQTQAVFANGSTRIRLQTGTAAGRIVLTPTFVTEQGIERTPASPAILELTVPEQAPVVLAARLEASVSALQVVVTGYSTTRSLTKMEVSIRRKGGKTEAFTFDVSPAAMLWFGSAGSLSYGGLFTATAPFTILGSTDDRNKLLEELEGISVKISNEHGTSGEFSAPAG